MRLPWTRRTPERAPLRWIDLDRSTAPDHPGVIDDVFARRLDGMTITGIFSAEECRTAVAALEAHGSERIDTMFGSVLGLPVNMRPDPDPGPEDRTGYLEAARRSRSLYRDAFGFEPFDRVAEAVGPMASGRTVEPPVEDGQLYNPGNVRWYEPGLPGLPSHVGNEFSMHEDSSLWHLRRLSESIDHLSYFVILQAPESGGTLSVFDLVFEDERPDVGEWGNSGRQDSAFDEVPAKRLAPEPGTMLLFGGGWRWHRVDPVTGSRTRVTFGGFASKSRDDSSLYFWI